MDYQTTSQDTFKMWYIVGILIIAAALWYTFGNNKPAEMPSTAGEQVQVEPVAANNTTENISTDLSQIPDVSADLNADSASVLNTVKGL